jgi:hypothetical protein
MHHSTPNTLAVKSLRLNRQAIMHKYGFTEAQYEDKMQTQPNLLRLLGAGMPSDVEDDRKFIENDAKVILAQNSRYDDSRMMQLGLG